MRYESRLRDGVHVRRIRASRPLCGLGAASGNTHRLRRSRGGTCKPVDRPRSTEWWGHPARCWRPACCGHAPGPLVVVCPHEDAADLLADDLRMFAAGVPRRDFPPGNPTLRERSVHDEIYGERLRTLKRLQAGRASPAGECRPTRTRWTA